MISLSCRIHSPLRERDTNVAVGDLVVEDVELGEGVGDGDAIVFVHNGAVFVAAAVLDVVEGVFLYVHIDHAIEPCAGVKAVVVHDDGGDGYGAIAFINGFPLVVAELGDGTMLRSGEVDIVVFIDGHAVREVLFEWHVTEFFVCEEPGCMKLSSYTTQVLPLYLASPPTGKSPAQRLPWLSLTRS